MTEKQLIQSVTTQVLQLSRTRKSTHYCPVGFFMLLVVVPIFLFIKELITGTPKTLEKMWLVVLIMTTLFSSLAWWVYKIQRKKLKFTIIETNLTNDELHKIIEKVVPELPGRIIIADEKQTEIKTSPSLWSGSWGELITILFDKQTVLINSICDPDKQPSIASYGRNKMNTDKLVEEIGKGNREDYSANGL